MALSSIVSDISPVVDEIWLGYVTTMTLNSPFGQML